MLLAWPSHHKPGPVQVWQCQAGPGVQGAVFQLSSSLPVSRRAMGCKSSKAEKPAAIAKAGEKAADAPSAEEALKEQKAETSEDKHFTSPMDAQVDPAQARATNPSKSFPQNLAHGMSGFASRLSA